MLLGVCAGYQLLGHRFRTTDGRDLPGFGLLDVETVPGGDVPRAVGEITVEPDPALGLPTLTGFENHGGRTILGADAQPLGRVLSGVGNTGPTAPRAPTLAGSSARTCTGRCWCATPRSPTCCCRGW